VNTCINDIFKESNIQGQYCKQVALGRLKSVWSKADTSLTTQILQLVTANSLKYMQLFTKQNNIITTAKTKNITC
jgi:hypothetical protein